MSNIYRHLPENEENLQPPTIMNYRSALNQKKEPRATFRAGIDDFLKVIQRDYLDFVREKYFANDNPFYRGTQFFLTHLREHEEHLRQFKETSKEKEVGDYLSFLITTDLAKYASHLFDQTSEFYLCAGLTRKNISRIISYLENTCLAIFKLHRQDYYLDDYVYYLTVHDEIHLDDIHESEIQIEDYDHYLTWPTEEGQIRLYYQNRSEKFEFRDPGRERLLLKSLA